MNAFGQHINRSHLRQWAYRLLTLSLVCRALIPVGFMPDVGALSKGVFKVVICSALGNKTISVDSDGKPVHEQAQHNHQPCAFGALATFSLPQSDALSVNYIAVAIATSGIPRAVILPPARAGPILGSRGPPLIS